MNWNLPYSFLVVVFFQSLSPMVQDYSLLSGLLWVSRRMCLIVKGQKLMCPFKEMLMPEIAYWKTYPVRRKCSKSHSTQPAKPLHLSFPSLSVFPTILFYLLGLSWSVTIFSYLISCFVSLISFSPFSSASSFQDR